VVGNLYQAFFGDMPAGYRRGATFYPITCASEGSRPLRHLKAPMSFYATRWKLKFPKYEDDHIGYKWIDVILARQHPINFINLPYSKKRRQNGTYREE
jgi:hypothetical protein